MSLHLIALSYDDVFEGPKKLCSLYDKLNADIVVSQHRKLILIEFLAQ